MTKPLRKFDRRRLPTRRSRTIADLKDAYGLSDAELADVYNEHYGTRLPCPLKDMLYLLAKNAIQAERPEIAGVPRVVGR